MKLVRGWRPLGRAATLGGIAVAVLIGGAGRVRRSACRPEPDYRLLAKVERPTACHRSDHAAMRRERMHAGVERARPAG